MRPFHSAILFALTLFSQSSANAQCDFEESQMLTDPNAAALDQFGNNVAVDGDVAVISAGGAPLAVIYRFDGSSWTEEHRVPHGGAVAIENNVAVVSRDVFRYDGTSWGLETSLPVDFVSSVSIDNGIILVGSGFDSPDPGGFAAIFSHDGVQWNLEDTIVSSDIASGDRFGSAVSIDGHNRVAIVGAPRNDDACRNGSPNCDSGSCYIFRFDGSSWVEEQKITASDEDRSRFFGREVSILGNLAVVGPFAYVFRFDGSSWMEEQILTIENTGLGTSVALGERGLLAIGGRFSTPGGLDGVVHIFRFDGSEWVSTQDLCISDGIGNSIGDGFGSSLGLSGSVLLVGAPFTNEACPMKPVCLSGSAYFFRQDNTCSEGAVNAGVGAASNVFFVNGSPGNDLDIVNVSLGEAVTFDLNAAPAGPLPGNYLLYVWSGFPVRCGNLMTMGEEIGCMVNPTPFLGTLSPQPFRCLRSSVIPSIVCRGVVEKPGPSTAPWSLTLNHGFQQPTIFTFQGVLQDQGSANSTGYSVTNATTVVAE